MNLSSPIDVCLSPDDSELFVADDNCIKVLNTSDGSHIRTIGEFGEEAGEFNYINGVCLSPNGELLFVSDRDNNRIQILRSDDGVPIQTIENFSSPKRVCVSPDGQKIFVADFYGVHVLRVSGARIMTIKKERGQDKFTLPEALCVSPDGQELFVLDMDRRVQVFRVEDGTYVRTISGYNNLTGILRPNAICLSPDGTQLYIACNHFIQVYHVNGDHVRKIGGEGAGFHHLISGYRDGSGDEPGQFNMPMGVCVSKDGAELYVADTRNGRVQVFQV